MQLEPPPVMDGALLTAAQLVDAMTVVMRRAVTVVPNDVRDALNAAVDEELSDGARLHLLTSLRNFDLSAKEDGLICTDTGWPLFYLVSGDAVRLDGGWSGVDALAARAVTMLTDQCKLRPTMVDPITRQPLGNVGLGFPCVKLRFDQRLEDSLRIIAVPKGGGGDVFGSFYRMLLAADGMTGVKKFLLDSFLESTYAGKTCPPNIIGIGIGGTSDVCMTLAKEASILRLVGERHPSPMIAELELELLDAFNEMGVGPMGGGGVTAAMDVHIEVAATHTACLAVAFNAQCHIGRRAVGRLLPSGELRWEEAPRWLR